MTGVAAVLMLSAVVQAEGLSGNAEITRGAHYRVLQNVREIQTPRGPRLQTNQIVELQGGMHRLVDGNWVPTDPKIELFQDGAIARNLQYGVIFAPNLATPGAIDLSLPDGQRLTSTLLGVAYTERDRSVMIAEVKDCAGILGGEQQNELTYVDAFTDFRISVQYVTKPDSISQNLIVEQQLPGPTEWGLSEDAVLEVMSEFTAFPAVRKEAREPIAGMPNEHISFGSMDFVTGRAFSLGNEQNSVPLAKTWETFVGPRTVLVERIPWKWIAPELAKLPAVARDWRKKTDAVVVARNQLRLPARREGVAMIKPIQKVPTPVGRPRGYLIDWDLVASGNSFLWTNGHTFYVSGPISIKTNTFEGGCVIKFAPTNSAKLTITGPATFLSTNYSPVIFTARDDQTVGEAITTNAVSGNYASTALELDYGSSGVLYNLHDIRISHASAGISFPTGGRGHTVRNLQLVNCGSGFGGYNPSFQILNGLFHKTITAFNVSASSGTTTGVLQHVTFNQCKDLYSVSLTLYGTNSLFVAVTNLQSFTGAYNGTNSDPADVFQTVGAGAHYLTTNSPFRDAGTTNIDTNLLSSLKQLTTYPPIIAAENVVVTNNLTLNPQAGRDSDFFPDLGAHYCPVDYVFGGAYLENSTITLGPGTAVAVYSPTNGGSSLYGIGLGNAAKLFSEGSPTNFSRLVRYTTVQEQWNTTWNTPPAESIVSAWSTSVSPETLFRFTQFSIPAADADHFSALGGGTAQGRFRDCEFYGGNLETLNPELILTNCLLHRVYTLIYDSGDIGPTFRNCLFYGGTLDLTREFGGTWTFRDNVFDRVAISAGGTFDHDYNGYITNAADQWLPSGGGHDVFTNSFTWQDGALGRFYQPTNSIFIGKGSTNANLLGLYHYTVLTNNVKETNSFVDIGSHYVATTNGVPIDSDSDGTPDYLEDANGNGTLDSGETSSTSASDPGLKVLITRPRNGAILP